MLPALFLFCEVIPLKKFTHRLIPLVLCITLTLGAFAYRPQQAKAVAGIDDAIVISALLSAFGCGVGLIFSNNGMTSGQIADGMAKKWEEYKAAVLKVDTTFAGWLGYEDMDALLQAIVISGGNSLMFPRAVARKFADFTTWFVNNLGLTNTEEKKTVFSSSGVANCQFLTLDSSGRSYVYNGQSRSVVLTRISASDYTDYIYDFDLGSPLYSYADFETLSPVYLTLDGKSVARIEWDSSNGGTIRTSFYYSSFSGSNKYYDGGFSLSGIIDDKYKAIYLASLSDGLAFLQYGVRAVDGVKKEYVKVMAPSDSFVRFTPDDVDESGFYVGTTINAGDYSHLGGKFGDAADDDTAPSPTVTGVGDGTATTVEELLQQILEQLRANTLAPTLEGVDTNTGDNTGDKTDEDAKPYLPYIPQIFEKIKDLPGTLSNIWETIKGLPAAIAEKIGAFFTTLWGWLQKVLDAIASIPAAVAEKVGELFKPDEALVTEITDTFKGKFGFFATLKKFGSDLFGMTAETEPPVIWVHLENAESKYGYVYGDKQKMLDLSWYQKYKANVDTLVSGFLWLGFLWLLFKRTAAIIQGGEMLAEYSHDFSQGRRDSNETKFQRYLRKD